MKVILLSDVKKVGKKGSIVEVSDGYGANYLIPNKLAVKVTKTSMDIKNKQDDDKAKQDEQNRLDAIALKEKMENLTVELKAKVGKDGKMFGAISTKQIVEEYKKQFDIELDKRKIALSTKQEIIGQILDKVLVKLQSLKKDKYLSLILRLLEKNAENGDQIVFSCDNKLGKKDLEGQDVVKEKGLTFAQKAGDFKGGIMLIGKVCDKDLSFKALIEEDKENIINKITAELFN